MFLSDGRRPLDAFPEVARQYGKLPLFIDMVLIYETFDVMPEFLWPNIPGYATFRKKQDGKWFAVIGSVPRCKVDPISLSDEDVEVINVKVDKEQIKTLLVQDGIYPAFHMDKKCWVSIICDEPLPDTDIQRMIGESHDV